MAKGIKLRVKKEIQIPFNWEKTDGSSEVEFITYEVGEVINAGVYFDNWKGYIKTGHLEIIDE